VRIQPPDHDTDCARAGFQEARRTHCGASGAECAHNERETRGSQGRMRRGWGRGEGRASEVARRALQEQRSFICNEIEDRLHQAAPRDSVSQGRSARKAAPLEKALTRLSSRGAAALQKLVAGKQKAAGLDRFGEAATHRAQREGGDGTFRFNGQGCRFTGKFEAAIELQACLLKEFR